MVFQTMNRLKWAGQLGGCEVVILHRGAPQDRKNIPGDSVTEVKRTYFVFSAGGKETVIPNHRVLAVLSRGTVVWRRAHARPG